ncbi:hypothetical protein AB0M36_15770 [Actinoplanes sp. NPDC051346]|uniref:hypothetical protein n=1 Tax=Actinoplanes sp. NPDC051346 TaxID=3155048 RepID=UPI00343B8D0A
MRFFSNDARESADEQAHDDRPERVQSEPVAVPGQRPPSPWSDSPGEANDSAADDDAIVDREKGTVRDSDRTEFEPNPQPAAFGASTVGGGVAANPLNDRWKVTDDEHGVAPADDAVESPKETNTTTYTSAATKGRDGEKEVVDVPLDDRGTFDDPRVIDEDATTPEASESTTAPEATSAPEADSAPVSEAASAPEVVEPVVAPAAPVRGTDQPENFFAAGDAQAFQERWREVQLRFVDSPKEATTEAAGLVDEAVEKLTASLRSRKEDLGGDSDDTEALRVQLRGYRDILNRILGL